MVVFPTSFKDRSFYTFVEVFLSQTIPTRIPAASPPAALLSLQLIFVMIRLTLLFRRYSEGRTLFTSVRL